MPKTLLESQRDEQARQDDLLQKCQQALGRFCSVTHCKPASNDQDVGGVYLEPILVSVTRLGTEIYQVRVAQVREVKRTVEDIPICVPDFITGHELHDLCDFPKFIDYYLNFLKSINQGLYFKGQIQLSSHGWHFVSRTQI